MGVSIKVSTAVFTKYSTKLAHVLRLTGLVEFTESGSVYDGYTYSLVSPNLSTSVANTCSEKLPSGVDGSFYCRMNRTAGQFSINICTTNTAAAFSDASHKFGFWVRFSLTPNQYGASAGGGSITDCNLLPSFSRNVNDLMRIRRTSGYWFLEISTDDGITYSTLHSYATAYTGDAYVMLDAPNPNSVGSISDIRGENTVTV